MADVLLLWNDPYPERVGHQETEHLERGRCYDCGRRGHTHFECPGVIEEKPEPKTHMVRYYSVAFHEEQELGPMGPTKARAWAKTLGGSTVEVGQ